MQGTTLLLSGCLLLALAVSCCEALLLHPHSCPDVCKHHHQYTDLEVVACNCPVGSEHHHLHNSADTTPTTTAAPKTTTTDVCDYLCAAQAGGSACDCSIAIVPGRK